MDIDTIISSMLNGNVVHDGIVIGTIFIAFYTFYQVMFSAVFTIFKK